MRIFQSSSAAERIETAGAFIRSLEPANEIVLVGASRDAVDDLAREVTSRRGATFGLHRFSFMQLVARLSAARLARQGLAPMTALSAEAVAARSTFEILQREALQYFTPVAGRPGFTRALAFTVGELRLAGLDADAIAKLPDPGPDVSELLREFSRQLASGSIADRSAMLQVAAATIGQGEAPWLTNIPILLLDLQLDSAIEREFISALATVAGPMLATVPAGDDRTLETLASLPRARRESRTSSEDTALGRLREFLFSEALPPRLEADALALPTTDRDSRSAPPAGHEMADGSVAFFSAPGEAREAVEIARRILLEAQGGIAFDRMAVLLRTPECYSGLLESALKRAGVPAYFARGTKRPDPSGRAFLALLACAGEGLSALRFAEYLSLSQVPQLTESGAPPRDRDAWVGPDDDALGPASDPGRSPVESLSSDQDQTSTLDSDEAPVVAGTLRAPWRWEELLVEAAVIGGRDRWVRRLDGLKGELKLKLASVASEEPESPRVHGIARDLRNLGHLRRFALPVIDALADLPTSAPWGTWLAQLELLAPMVLRAPGRVLTVLAELKPMSAIGPVTLDEIRDVLTERLATLEQEPPARRYGCVFVATLDQARGRQFDVVFVPGLAERLFPQKPREDPILLDRLRKQLDANLRRQIDRGRHERLLLRLAAGAATSRIYLSYPRLEVSESRPRVPSFYALDVQRATTGRVPDYDELERDAALAAQARLAWPAPASPSQGIDDMEHDLGVLGPLLRGSPAAEIKGRGRYLLELNPHLARSLRTRWARWEKKWSAADGLYGARETTVAALAAHRLKARPYSVSALQKFAICPYQFFLSAVHRLEPREEAVPLDRMDPLTRGSVFHRVQAELMRELQRRGSLPLSASSVAAAFEVADAVLDRVAEAYREELAPAIDRVWRSEIDSIGADLRAWMQQVADSRDDWRPRWFEFGFGFPPAEGRDPESLATPVELDGGWRLHGIVDLIEEKRGGEELRVTDHKTGSNRTREPLVIGGGEVLQPVLYGLAIEAAMKRPVIEGRLFFCTTAGGFAERIVALDPHARRCGIEVLEIVDRAIEHAHLVPAPKERACLWCDFREVCGPHEEKRIERKPTRPLGDLLELRGCP